MPPFPEGPSFGFGNENQPAAGLCVSRSAETGQFRKVVVVDASGHVKVGRAIDVATPLYCPWQHEMAQETNGRPSSVGAL